MGRYAISTDYTKGVKKSLKKWGKLPISNELIDGTIYITNLRKYSSYAEVDVIFEGKIQVRLGRESKKWQSPTIMKTHNISKIKLNRFLRKTTLVEVQRRMNYFGIHIDYYYNIGKIKWT